MLHPTFIHGRKSDGSSDQHQQARQMMSLTQEADREGLETGNPLFVELNTYHCRHHMKEKLYKYIGNCSNLKIY